VRIEDYEHVASRAGRTSVCTFFAIPAEFAGTTGALAALSALGDMPDLYELGDLDGLSLALMARRCRYGFDGRQPSRDREHNRYQK
jgi:hypothetical protein